MSSSLVWPRVVFGVLLVVITYLTLTPDPVETEPGFAVTRYISDLFFGSAEYADKVGHCLAYGLLGLTAYWARIALFSKRWAVTIGLALYGVALEGLQGIGGVRSPEVADALANALGATSGFFGGTIVAYLKERLQ